MRDIRGWMLLQVVIDVVLRGLDVIGVVYVVNLDFFKVVVVIVKVLMC